MPCYRLEPQDLLFLRDARPITGTFGGRGAHWPLPTTLCNALHAALHRLFLVSKENFHAHPLKSSTISSTPGQRSQYFGALQTFGPFPFWDGKWFFPAPKDVGKQASDSHAEYEVSLFPMSSSSTIGRNNLPQPLSYPLGAKTPPGKKELNPWWSKEAWEAYLRGERVSQERHTVPSDVLYTEEWITGIGISPETLTTGTGEAEGRIYSTQYLRLKDGVSLAFDTSLREQGEEKLSHLLDGHPILFGGQGKVCFARRLPQKEGQGLEVYLPLSAPIKDHRVKWVLLSPAVFPKNAPTKKHPDLTPHPGGWLPSWVDPQDGKVLLRPRLPRGSEEDRAAYRERIRKTQPVQARLVAACIPKPLIISSWENRLHLPQKSPGPSATLLAVPPGSVYYFEAESSEEAQKLANLLSWHGSKEKGIKQIENRRSALMGEKGFGIGVCGPWEFFEEKETKGPEGARNYERGKT